MLASWKREREIVLLLLQHGADVNRVNYNGATALLYASAGGDPDIMRTLQKSGANVQVKDKMGQTALHWAVAADQV
jgi:ankyrin repeat protein